MTKSVTIHRDNGSPVDLEIGSTAAEHIRLKFNPSQLEAVEIIKKLTGSLISYLDEIRSEAIGENDSTKVRHCSVAITEVTKASMCAVLAATTGL